MTNKIKKFTVKITKDDGAESIYLVAALSRLDAERVCLSTVYASKYALAVDGWKSRQTFPDLISESAKINAIEYALSEI